MRFASELVPATLIRRYKRFLADVELADGTTVTAHVANPGAMTGLQAEGARVWLSRSPSLTRKLPYSWELIEVDFGSGSELTGVNTMHHDAERASSVLSPVVPWDEAPEPRGYGEADGDRCVPGGGPAAARPGAGPARSSGPRRPVAHDPPDFT